MAQNEPKNKLIENPVLILTCAAVAATETARFLGVKRDGTLAGAGEKPFGITNVEAAVGELSSAVVLGVAICRAGAAITDGAEVELDASGRVIPFSAGLKVGQAVGVSAQAGDLVSVRLY